MISKKLVCFALLLAASTTFAQAQFAFFEVTSTPYDRQMLRVESTLVAPRISPARQLSFALVNNWMTELRSMPYHYSRRWLTPAETGAVKAGDCKAKAVALYDRMHLNGATSLRLVIGKRREYDSLTHAWLEWDTNQGTLLLDPTFNWAATMKTANPRSYVAFYGYQGRHKLQATGLLFASQRLATPNPVAPAHGVVTRPIPRRHMQRLSNPAIRSNDLFARTMF